MKYMRVVDNIAIEELVPVPGFSIQQCFHESLLAQMETVADDVQVGWVKQEDGSFAAPEPAPE